LLSEDIPMCNGDEEARRFSCGTAIAVAAALLILSACKPACAVVPEPEKEATTSGGIRIHVVDAAGQPVPGAHVFASVVADGKVNNQDLVADSQGQAQVELPATIIIATHLGA